MWYCYVCKLKGADYANEACIGNGNWFGRKLALWEAAAESNSGAPPIGRLTLVRLETRPTGCIQGSRRPPRSCTPCWAEFPARRSSVCHTRSFHEMECDRNSIAGWALGYVGCPLEEAKNRGRIGGPTPTPVGGPGVRINVYTDNW